MAGSNVLKEDRVTSTIHIINGLVRGLTHKRQAKKADTDYFVFAGNTVDIVIKMIQNRAAKDAIVVDDLGLQIVDRLYQEGLKSITLILTRIPKEHLTLISGLIKRTFPNIKFDIKHIEEIDYMKTDLLISNPPYGAIGANITDTLRQKIDYEEFINLLPANDYKRNKTKDLFNYQSEMETIPAGKSFTDAYITTHIARIYKTKINTMTLNEFELSQYIDKSLNKYLTETVERKHYAIDSAIYKPSLKMFETITVEQSIYIGKRDVKSEHLPYSKNSIVTKYNMNKITKQEVLDQSAKSEQALGRVGDFYLIKFNTEIEKTNFARFMYSKNGFRFLCKLFVALNVDSSISLNKFMPKVDWTRSWTVEEILADYGYTEDEIKEVTEDLKNYKGMED